MNEKSTLELVIETAINMVEIEQKSMEKSDQDWPAMFVVGNNQAINVCLLAVDIANDADKRRLGDFMLPGMILQLKGEATAFISSAWMAVVDSSNVNAMAVAKEIGNKISLHPNKKEVVMIQAFTHDKFCLNTAEIIRSEGNPPTLGPWENHEGITTMTKENNAGGIFADGVKKALRIVASGVKIPDEILEQFNREVDVQNQGKMNAEFELEEM